VRRFAVFAAAVALLLLEPGVFRLASAQSAPAAPSPSSESNASPKKPSTAQSSARKAATKTSAKAPAKSSRKSSAKTAGTKKRHKRVSPRVRRVRQAFVASVSLRPMAQQLLQDRTPAAYAGVEAYARRHAKEDAGALAWLVIGYARTLDHDYPKAIDPLSRAKAGASELGDYVAYYLGDAYLQTGRTAEALAALADFGKKFPDSLLMRDAHLAYARALLQEGRAGGRCATRKGSRSSP
jgi:soluble lytic murein transglycosylase